MNTPVVFVACSNNNDDFLRELRGEMHDIWKTMDELDFHRVIKFDQPPYDADAEILYDKVSRIGDRLTLFHYSGHANGHLFRTQDEDYGKDQLLALLSGKQPYLVFLNGCSTYGYVDFLLEKGVKAVIATSINVKDSKARLFSAKFYESLAKNKTLEEAFIEAKSVLPNAGEIESVGRKAMGPGWGNLKRKEPCPWGLYHSDDLGDYNNPGESISILKWVLTSTAKDTLKLPASSQQQQQIIMELFRQRDAEVEGVKESQYDIAEYEENQKRNWTPERQERINDKIKKRNDYEQKIDALTRKIEEKRLAFRHRLRQAEESEVANRLFPIVSILNYTQPRKVVSDWLKVNPKQQSLSFMLQGTKLCGLPLLQERILDTINFRFRSEESCLRYTIECSSNSQPLVTEDTLWQKLKDDRRVGGSTPEDAVAIIFKQLGNSEVEPRNFLLVIKDALACANITHILNFWEQFCRLLERQSGWAGWSGMSKRAVLIVRYEAPPSEEGEWELAVPLKQLKQLKIMPPSFCVVPQIQPIPETEIKEWTDDIPDFAQIDTTPFVGNKNRMLSVLENISTQIDCPELYRLIENKLKTHY